MYFCIITRSFLGIIPWFVGSSHVPPVRVSCWWHSLWQPGHGNRSCKVAEIRSWPLSWSCCLVLYPAKWPYALCCPSLMKSGYFRCKRNLSWRCLLLSDKFKWYENKEFLGRKQNPSTCPFILCLSELYPYLKRQQFWKGKSALMSIPWWGGYLKSC